MEPAISIRVLYLLDSLAAGGAETSLVELVPSLRRQGIEVHVAYFVDKLDLADRFSEAGAQLWPLTDRRGRVGRVLDVRRLCKSVQPDLVHTTLFEADVAGRVGARLAGVPAVSSIVNEMYGPEQRRAGLRTTRVSGARILDAATGRLVTRFHAISASVADVMSERLHMSRDRVEVIPRARDPESLGTRTADRRAAVRRRLSLEESTSVVLAVARQEPQKGLDVLLRAMPQLAETVPGVRLIVAGREGSQTVRLQSLVGSLGLEPNVKFLGSRRDIADLMVAADVLAFPSRWEGFGGTIVEAMALECPIVCSDLAVLHEVVGPCLSARFVPADDPRALAAALAASLQSRPSSDVLRHARVRFESHYTTAQCGAAMLTFYRRALGDRPLGQ